MLRIITTIQNRGFHILSVVCILFVKVSVWARGLGCSQRGSRFTAASCVCGYFACRGWLGGSNCGGLCFTRDEGWVFGLTSDGIGFNNVFYHFSYFASITGFPLEEA